MAGVAIVYSVCEGDSDSSCVMVIVTVQQCVCVIRELENNSDNKL